MDAIDKVFTPRNAAILIGVTFLVWRAARMLRGLRSMHRLYRTAPA